jgi:hypothetical protein
MNEQKKFVEDTKGNWYLIPSKRKQEFDTCSYPEIQFNDFMLNYHLSQWSFENPVKDDYYLTPLHKD